MKKMCTDTANGIVSEKNSNPVICFDRASYNMGVNAQYDMGIDDSGKAFTVIAKGPGGGVLSK